MSEVLCGRHIQKKNIWGRVVIPKCLRSLVICPVDQWDLSVFTPFDSLIWNLTGFGHQLMCGSGLEYKNCCKHHMNVPQICNHSPLFQVMIFSLGFNTHFPACDYFCPLLILTLHKVHSMTILCVNHGDAGSCKIMALIVLCRCPIIDSHIE